MSRSYRQPYAAVTGKYTNSGDDKRVARRLWRRVQNTALRKLELNLELEDEFLLPARYEASHNDVWGWGRDGNQHFHPKPQWRYMENFWFHWLPFEAAMERAIKDFEREQKYYAQLQRK